MQGNRNRIQAKEKHGQCRQLVSKLAALPPKHDWTSTTQNQRFFNLFDSSQNITELDIDSMKLEMKCFISPHGGLPGRVRACRMPGSNILRIGKINGPIEKGFAA